MAATFGETSLGRRQKKKLPSFDQLPWDGPWHGLHIFPKKNEKTHLLEFTRPSFWGPSTKKKTCWGKMSPQKNSQKMASAPPCILIPI